MQVVDVQITYSFHVDAVTNHTHTHSDRLLWISRLASTPVVLVRGLMGKVFFFGLGRGASGASKG